MPRTASALIIGNEILTGKVQEANLVFLARELFRMGVELRRVVVCKDDIDVIATELRALRAAHDMVFTSGGVGPTHDDITLPALAAAFQRPLVRSPLVEKLIRDHWGERTTPWHLRMADMPEGAELVQSDDVPWPVVVIDSVYVLPGVPEIFKLKFGMLRARIGADRPFVSRAVFTSCDEGEIAAMLDRVGQAHPAVSIGSYPSFRDPEYRVKITFDALEAAEVDAALADCVAALPSQAVLRIG